MNFASKFKIVPLFTTTDYNNGADGDSINMGKVHRATIIITFGALTGNAVLKLYSGATAGTKTSALTFQYKYSGAATGSDGSDVYSDAASSAALTLTGTTFANRCLVIEIEATEMDTYTGGGEEWLTLEIGTEASAGIAHGIAICETRYGDEVTVLT
jgi:hypothetical protein